MIIEITEWNAIVFLFGMIGSHIIFEKLGW
jgi:hypothetical protein